MWVEKDVMAYKGCDENKAIEIMNGCREHYNIKGYSPVEKQRVIDYIDMMDRIEQERRDRHQADVASIEVGATLKEQVVVLKEQLKTLQEDVEQNERKILALENQNTILAESSKSSSNDARKARRIAFFANLIAFIALVFAIYDHFKF